MAGAFVQGKFAFTDASSQSSRAVVFDSNVTAGNLICGMVKFGTATSVFSSITDSLGNTYTIVDSTPDGNGTGVNTVKSFYARNIAGGANTVTLNFTAANGVYPRILVLEYSGLDTSASVLNANQFLNQAAVGTATDGAASGATGATTTVDGCTIVGLTVNHDFGPPATHIAAGTNFTARTAGSTAANNFDSLLSEDLTQASQGVIKATFTNLVAGTPDFTTMLLAFRTPGAATGVIRPPRTRLQAVNRGQM